MICLKYIINSHAAKKVFSYLANYSVPILLVFTLSNMFTGCICYSFIVQLILYIVFNRRILIFSLVIYCNYLNQKKKKFSQWNYLFIYKKNVHLLFPRNYTYFSCHHGYKFEERNTYLFSNFLLFIAFLDNRKILKILSIYFK